MNYLREKVDNLSKKMIVTYNTTIGVESSVYSDFPYMALYFLRTNYNEIYQLVISHIFPDDSGRTNYLLYNYNDTVITRLFLAAEDYLTLSGRDTSRWITETSFLIKEKE